MANFESFSRTLLSLKSEPHVTFQRRGVISLNRSAFVALGSPTAVELLYDREARLLGLQPATVNGENAYHVRRGPTPASGPWVITAMAFIKFYEIDVSIARRWPAYLDGAVLCADLSRPGTAVTSNRARRSLAEGGPP